MVEVTEEQRAWAVQSILKKRVRLRHYRETHVEKLKVDDHRYYLEHREKKRTHDRQYYVGVS